MLKKHIALSLRYTVVGLALLFSACASTGNPQNNISYIAENAAREGVIVTASGLQYNVIKAVNGPKPTERSSVTMHYVGRLTDGTEFGNTRNRGEPPQFPLGGTILGLIEGVQLMSVGDTYRFVIPSNLAYEDRANGKYIRPGATLIYEVELLGFE